MAKTKPIGVRFRQDMLDSFEQDGIADSPQKALNFLTDFYHDHKPNKINLAEKFKDSKIFEPKPTSNNSQNNEAIQKQIDAVRAEKIPDHRNTIYGRRSWQQEQDKKVSELRKQL